MNKTTQHTSKHVLLNPSPDGERHGSIFSQFTLWLGANLQITAMVTGALTIVFGGDVFGRWPVLCWGRLPVGL